MQGMKAGTAAPTTQAATDEPHELLPSDQQSRQLEQQRLQNSGGRSGGARGAGGGARGLTPNGQGGSFGPGPAIPPPIDAPVPGGQ
jgi:hypothetical protein